MLTTITEGSEPRQYCKGGHGVRGTPIQMTANKLSVKKDSLYQSLH